MLLEDNLLPLTCFYSFMVLFLLSYLSITIVLIARCAYDECRKPIAKYLSIFSHSSDCLAQIFWAQISRPELYDTLIRPWLSHLIPDRTLPSGLKQWNFHFNFQISVFIFIMRRYFLSCPHKIALLCYFRRFFLRI
jgi:hypothetical protein